jgi:hypothetical protein
MNSAFEVLDKVQVMAAEADWFSITIALLHCLKTDCSFA